MLRAKTLFSIGAFFAMSAEGTAEVRLEQPLALVTNGEATIERPGQLTALRAYPGTELFLGDRVSVQDKPIQIAFCPALALTKIGVPAKFELGAREVRFETTPAPVETTKLPVCRLPSLEKLQFANNIVDLNPTPPSGTLADRIATLTPEQRASLEGTLRPINSMLSDNPSDLVATVARAVLFEESGLREDAIAEYRHIGASWEGAEWTRQVVDRLNEQKIPSPRGVELPEATVTHKLTGQTFAFLIGISRYKFIESLEYADKDVDLFASYLQSRRGGSLVLGKNLRLLKNEDATLARITQELTHFVSGRGSKDSTLILFVAAHGRYICTDRKPGTHACQPGKEVPVILTHDSETQEPNVSGFSMVQFYKLVTEQAHKFGRVLVYFDVCHGGVLGALPPETGLPSPVVQDIFSTGGLGDVGLLMASTRYKPEDRMFEYAYEDVRFGGGHGIFTYYAVRGMNHEAPTVNNQVLFNDLKDYVVGKVRQVERRQRPDGRANVPELTVVDDASKEGIDIATFDTSVAEVRPRSRTPRHVGKESPATREPNTPTTDSQIEDLRVRLEDEGQRVILRYLLGEEVPQRREDFEQGGRVFEAALKLAPDAAFNESRMLFCNGRAMIFDKKYGEAQRLLERSIRIDPNRAYAYNALGIAYLEELPDSPVNLDRAIDAFQDAIRLAPYWAYPLHNLALAYEQKGDYERAIRLYKQAKRVVPFASYPAYSEGLLLLKLNRIDEAKKDFLEAIEIAKGQARQRTPYGWARLSDGYNALATLEANREHWKQAEAYLAAALKADPKNPLALHNQALLDAGPHREPERAISAWRDLLKAEPNNLTFQLCLARTLHSVGRTTEALEVYGNALAAHASVEGIRRAVALIYVRSGDIQRARAIIAQGLENKKQNSGLQVDQVEIEDIARGRKPVTPEYRSAWLEARRHSQGRMP